MLTQTIGTLLTWSTLCNETYYTCYKLSLKLSGLLKIASRLFQICDLQTSSLPKLSSLVFLSMMSVTTLTYALETAAQSFEARFLLLFLSHSDCYQTHPSAPQGRNSQHPKNPLARCYSVLVPVDLSATSSLYFQTKMDSKLLLFAPISFSWTSQSQCNVAVGFSAENVL